MGDVGDIGHPELIRLGWPQRARRGRRAWRAEESGAPLSALVEDEADEIEAGAGRQQRGDP
jgi:hypothetical protein